MAKILISSIGTLGDLNPAIALGKELRAHGHNVGFACCRFYQTAVESAGLIFHETAPDYNPRDPELCRAIMHPLKTLLNIHRLILDKNSLQQSYNDFLTLAPQYDFVASNIFSYAVKAACLKTKTPWVALHLSPLCFFSADDPPAIYPFTALLQLPQFVRKIVYSCLFRVMFKLADYWGREVLRLYKREGLSMPASTILDAPFSKILNIALFSPLFAKPQKDWRSPLLQVGFLNYSGEGAQKIPEEVLTFLNIGRAPLFFTFGSTANMNEKTYLDPILSFVESTNERVLVSVSSERKKELCHLENDQLHFCEFIPYLTAMPKMKMVIHQGGVGTTSLAMNAGIPQIILPDCTDQYDNAFRARGLGVAEVLPLRKLTDKKLKKLIEKISSDEKYFERSKKLSSDLQSEPVKERVQKIVELALLDHGHSES